ncbi:hypothetical protein LshimejAT787_2400640 [Lyophyllum shimeji]|uniref:Uncharacterized protein n=1 Tax=Lyophyllum shimeji TaxID=47721 RepID=A0A9P3Q1H0_LYOSH|nr:hypothetical protein LshimejAT787_2400640 [Lyophyllum shimeji]
MATAESKHAKRDRSVLTDDESDAESKRDKPELSLLTNNEIHTDEFDFDTPSTLTPLSDLSDSPITRRDDPDLDDTKWRRYAALEFCLPGETADSLKGPGYQYPILGTEALIPAANKLIRDIFNAILDEWPTADSGEADGYTLSLVNAHAFMGDLFESRLRRKAARDNN